MQKPFKFHFKNKFSFKHKIKIQVWRITWLLLAKPFPRKIFNFWKIFILRVFGAKIHKTAVVYSSAKIYCPWNLVMFENSCIADEVEFYNVDLITIKSSAIISQKAFLCTASHEITDRNFSLITSPIIIENNVWVGACAFIGMGVTVGEGAVVGATSSVYKDIEKWTVVGGNPAKFIKKRIID